MALPIEQVSFTAVASTRNNHIVRVCMLLFFTAHTMSAQKTAEQKEDYNAFSVGVHLKNMHLWHGFVVTPGPMIATSLEFNSSDAKLTLGVWGGTSFGASTDVTHKNTGETIAAHYQEFSLYSKYRFSDTFFMEAVSHNNYTGVEERGDVLHYWSYDKTQGYNFVDVGFGYLVTPNRVLNKI